MDNLRLFIIDGYYWIHRAYHASKHTFLTSPSGEPTGATHIFMTSLLKLIREEEPDLLCVAMEGGGKTFRHELSTEYKANRSAPADDFTIQRKRIEQILTAMKIPLLRVPGFEADDIIGTVVRYAQQDGIDSIICSRDKDMLQLVGDGIEVFHVQTGNYLGVDEVKDKFGVGPSQVINSLALMGDASDNVFGVPGIGVKTAAKLLLKYNSIESILEHLPDLKPKQRATLEEHGHRLKLNKKLVTIDCKVPLDINYYSFMLGNYDENSLIEIFTELDFNQIMAQMDLDD